MMSSEEAFLENDESEEEPEIEKLENKKRKLEKVTASPSKKRRLNDDDSKAKTTGNKATGIVKWYDPQKGYGFIANDDGSDDLYFHATEIHCKSEKQTVENDSKVEFEIVDDERNGKNKAI